MIFADPLLLHPTQFNCKTHPASFHPIPPHPANITQNPLKYIACAHTTGQHDGARKQLRRSLDVLTPIAEAGVPIVGMEPACVSVWRSDAPELLPDEARVPLVAKAIHTLAELLETVEGYQPPDLSGHTIVAQPHCHHASVLGWEADAKLLKRTGAKLIEVGGCCGMAGNFGFERGHYEVSVKVFEHDLKPAIEAAGPDAIILADGFSCRKQIKDLAGLKAQTLAQMLAGHSIRFENNVSVSINPVA